MPTHTVICRSPAAITDMLHACVLADLTAHISQAHAGLYQWHPKYPLNADVFKKCPSGTVLATIRKFAEDFEIAKHADFCTEVVSVRQDSTPG